MSVNPISSQFSRCNEGQFALPKEEEQEIDECKQEEGEAAANVLSFEQNRKETIKQIILASREDGIREDLLRNLPDSNTEALLELIELAIQENNHEDFKYFLKLKGIIPISEKSWNEIFLKIIAKQDEMAKPFFLALKDQKLLTKNRIDAALKQISAEGSEAEEGRGEIKGLLMQQKMQYRNIRRKWCTFACALTTLFMVGVYLVSVRPDLSS